MWLVIISTFFLSNTPVLSLIVCPQRCVTGDDILRDWASALKRIAPAGSASIRKMRAHVLKIDVEGHDYDVSPASSPPP